MNALQRLKRVLLGRKVPSLAAPPANAEMIPLALGPNGELYARMVATDTPGGNTVEATAGPIDDNLASLDQRATDTRAHLYGYDDVGANQDRLRSGVDSADSQASRALGVLIVAGRNWAYNGSTWDRIRIGNDAADSLNALSYTLATQARGSRFNGSTWDRERNNVSTVLVGTGAKTATPTIADQVNYNGRGLVLVMNVTAITATPSVTLYIDGSDNSGGYYNILTSAAITAVGVYTLKVYPGLVAAANLVANDVLPRNFRVRAVHLDADSINYSLIAQTIL